MIRELLLLCQESKASDLHLVKDEPPVIRVNGLLSRTAMSPLSEQQIDEFIKQMLTPAQRDNFSRNLDVDFALTMPGIDRFRVNAHRERGAISIALRRLPTAIPSLSELGVPRIAADFARAPHGLVLLTGPVGMGKTTTLASMVDLINHERECMIVTIEDPIEYLHVNHKSIVKQREVSIDTPAFDIALKHCLRQDPNVIVIGEMRDTETIAIALTAAETGHLILATLHAPDTQHAIERIIDVFPAQRQTQVRQQIAGCLVGVLTQLLLPTVDNSGRVLATEVLVASDGVRNIIRESQFEQITTAIQTGGRYGMHTLDKSLKQLVDEHKVSYQTAISKARYPLDFQKL